MKSWIQSVKVRHSDRIAQAESEAEVLELWKENFSGIINSESPGNVRRERLLFEQTLEEYLDNTMQQWWFVEIYPLEVEMAWQRLKMNKAARPDMIACMKLNICSMVEPLWLYK